MTNKLTPRQAKFVSEYARDPNAAQAAIRAGFSVKGASQAGHNLLNMPKIADAIEALRRGGSKRA